MRGLRAHLVVLKILGLALVLAGGACLLPDNPYQRWQLLDGTMHASARWIYERTHFDPRSIDVVIVGPSRTRWQSTRHDLSRSLPSMGAQLM